MADHDDPSRGIVTLDTQSAEVGWNPDVIKLDVEGDELKVLRAAAGSVDRRHPHFIIEVHSAELDRAYAAWLVERGYRPRIVSQRRFLAGASSDGP